VVAEPTMIFAGWQTRLTPTNGDQYKVDYLINDTTRGRIAYTLAAGTYQVSTSFTQWTWPRLIGNGVSGLTAIMLLGWLVSRKYDTI